MHIHKVGANCLNIGYALTALGQKCTECISSSLDSLNLLSERSAPFRKTPIKQTVTWYLPNEDRGII